MASSDPARLYQLLLNTGLQTKDNPLHQVIHSLIDHAVSTNKAVSIIISSNSSSSFNQGLQGIQGIQGIPGVDGDGFFDEPLIDQFIPTNPLVIGSLQAAGIGSAAIINIGPFTLNDAVNPVSGLAVTVTLPTITTGVRSAVNFNMTSAGSSAHDQQGCVFTLNSGYTGASKCFALKAETNVASTGFVVGVQGHVFGASAVNIGVNAVVASGTQNIALFAGLGGIDGSSFSSAITAAIVAANGVTTSDLFQAYSNITKVASLTDAGLFNSKSLSSSSTIVATGNISTTGGYLLSGAIGSNSPNPGDLIVNRGTTGAIFFGNSGSIYLFYDGTKFNLQSSLSVIGSITASTFVQAAAASGFSWAASSALLSPSNGTINIVNNANSSGIGIDITTDSLLKVRNRAQNADGNISFATFTHSGAEIDKTYQIYAPATLATVTMSAGQSRAIINPAGTIAVLTVTLPPSPVDGQVAGISFTQVVSALTVNAPGGATVIAAPTSAAVDTTFRFLYNASSTTWFPAS